MCNNNCDGIRDILKMIVKLQKRCGIDDDNMSCDRPFLGGGTNNILNTRPVSLYTCPSNTLWTMPYTDGELSGTSSVFRVEKVDGCCATLRVLREEGETLEATSSFFTINLNCVGVIQCLADTLVANL